ncbi:MAG: orotidine-5'-phosphate decarboxylase [Ktedonobacteraceae bacterium]
MNEQQKQNASSMTAFVSLLEQRWRKDTFVCVGLDPIYDQLPAKVREDRSIEDALFVFNRDIIDTTHDLVCAYKPNSAFYEALGDVGARVLVRTVHYIKQKYPSIPVILDAKRADIGNTNRGYAQAAFDIIAADAITVHPYLGKEALAPFLERKEKGIIVLVKTSNPGSNEFQNLLVGEKQEPLYQVIARNIANSWNTNRNCALVVGATYPSELRQVRAIVGDMPILIPGIGVQGGDIEATVKAGKDSRSWGMIINSSRGIIYVSQGDDFAQAARDATQKLRTVINTYR